MQLCSSLSTLCHWLSLGLEWKLTFSSCCWRWSKFLMMYSNDWIIMQRYLKSLNYVLRNGKHSKYYVMYISPQQQCMFTFKDNVFALYYFVKHFVDIFSECFTMLWATLPYEALSLVLDIIKMNLTSVDVYQELTSTCACLYWHYNF